MNKKEYVLLKRPITRYVAPGMWHQVRSTRQRVRGTTLGRRSLEASRRRGMKGRRADGGITTRTAEEKHGSERGGAERIAARQYP